MTDEPIILGGRYQLEEVIGRGGMAEVWRARDRRLDRQVAVKRLRVDLATDQIFQARFQREAQSAAGLNHPNIVSVYDTGEKVDPTSGTMVPYIVMELVEGLTLRDLLRRGQPIQPEKAFEYTMGVLEALSFSHKNDIVHRDIKPANVMITPSGQVKVMDFGIARAVSDTAATMTQTAAVIGTAQYLSPEQARGEQVDARSDIYSAGCLLYELLTGRPPFIGDSPVSVAYQHVREMPVPPSQLDPEITPEMDAIVMKALAKRTEDRYQSAKAMRDDCWRLLNGQAVTARVPSVVAMGSPVSNAPTRALPVDEDPYYDPEPAYREPAGDYDNHEDYEDEDAEPPAKRKISPATFVLIGLLVLVLGALGVFAWRLLSPDPTKNIVQVPTVLGFQEEAAVQLLEQSKLTPQVKHESGPAAGKGTVTAQNPNGGEPVQVGSTVTITINDGPPMAKIPAGLVGKQEEEARKLLTETGFTNIQTLAAPATNDTVNAKKGEVVEVVPGEGEQASTDQQVTVYVASGRTQMPDLTGKPRAEAVTTLAALGFTDVKFLDASAGDEPLDYVADQVVRTSPEAGAALASGQQITIYLATGRSELPNVRSLTEQDAKAKLIEEGFLDKNITVQYVEGSAAQAGTVIGQSPTGGQHDRARTEIILQVVKPVSATAPSSSSASATTNPTTTATTR